MADQDKLRAYLRRVTVDLADARRRLEEGEARSREPVAVVGMACRFPGAPTVDAYWDLLVHGRSGVLDEAPGDRFDLRGPVRDGVVYTTRGAFLADVAGWDAEFFGVPPREALRMDPQQRLALELAWEAFEDAGTPAPALAGSRTAVMVGFSDPTQYAQLEQEAEGRRVFYDPYAGQGAAASLVAGRVAYQFDLRGPSFSVDTACSSSLTAVHLAAAALRRGDCDLALAGGVHLTLHPLMYINGCSTSMFARDGVLKAFDARADGYVIGEGAGLVVLERLSDALRRGHRVRAVIRGSAVNQDGRSNGLTAPNRGAQVEVIRRALDAAGAAPQEVGYVEAHGSGTQLGDAIELGALAEVFGGARRDPVRVGAVKTNLGHTQAAAGAAGLIKTVLVLEHGVVPPNLNLAEPSAAAARGALAPAGAEPAPLAPRNPENPGAGTLAGVSSFGWSGTNAHVVLAPATSVTAVTGAAAVTDATVVSDATASGGSASGPPDAAAPWAELLPVSASCQDALAQRLGDLAHAADALDGAGAFADYVHTLQSGRAGLELRGAVVADRATAPAALRARAAEPGVRRTRDRPRVAFLLPGVGDQYRGLGQGLYRDEPRFAATVDECVRIAGQRCGVDLREALFGDPEPVGEAFPLRAAQPADSEQERAVTAHLSLFTVEYALARLLEQRGIRPDVLIGYSLGEYVAAALAGVFALADALWIVAERARLIEAAPEGRMLAVAADAARIAAVLPPPSADTTPVDVAALNGPTMTVLSGTPAQIERAGAALAAAGIAARRLRSAHPFHSALLAPAGDRLAEIIAAVPRQSPTVQILSNATGAPLTDEQAVDPRYWARHLTLPVRFAAAATSPAAKSADVFVELGAGQTLGGLVRQIAQGRDGDDDETRDGGRREPVIVGTLPARWQRGAATNERSLVLESCARLWELGVDLDWGQVRRTNGRLTTLPVYPFQRRRFWPEAAAPSGERPAPSDTDHCYVPCWRREAPPAAPRGEPLAGTSLVILASRDDAVGRELARRARTHGASVTRIDIDRPEQHRETLAAAAATAGRTVHVVHLADPPDAPRRAVFRDEAALREGIRRGYDAPLLAVQALAETLADRQVRLLTVTSAACEVLGGDGVAPERMLAHGFGRAVRYEYPWLSWRGLDLAADGAAPEELAAQIHAELRDGRAWQAQPGEGADLVARRGGRRWLKSWDPIPQHQNQNQSQDGDRDRDPGRTAAPPPYRSDGTYLITGGTRGLGLALARHLVRHGVRRLTLVGRTDLQRAAAADPAGKAAQSLRDIAELEASGAQVQALAGDAGSPEALREALRACRARFGPVTGVFHAAGTPAGGLAYQQTPDRALHTIAPKVLAMQALAQLVGPDTPEPERPELLVLYSSALTVFGGLGESDYCAANSVLDAYAAALAECAAATTRVLSVAWGPWRHDDWQGADGAGGAFAQRLLAHRREHGFGDVDGCLLLDRLITSTQGPVLALRTPLERMHRWWAAASDLGSLTPAPGAAHTGAEPAHAPARFPRPRLRTAYAAPRSELEEAVAENWGRHLGIDAVGVHDPFFELGGNSLIGLAMVAELGERLGRPVAPALLFEHPTVAELAAALAPADAAGPGAQPASSRAIGSTRGERRRRGRAPSPALPAQ